MTYACPTWEHAVDTHLLKLRHLQNRLLAVLEILTGAHQSANCTWLSKFLVYDYIIKLCTKQAEAQHRKYERLKLGGSQAYDHSAD
jgi:hypothetical protein